MPRDCPSCQSSFFDLFSVVVNPGDFYWNEVDGGGGSRTDGMLGDGWFYGGPNARPTLRSLNAPVTLTFDVDTRTPHLTLMLDTASLPDADGDYASWGTLEAITVTPITASGPGSAIEPAWTVSPFDPDAGTVWQRNADGTTRLELAANDFGAPDGPGNQGIGIWGIGAVLPTSDPRTGQPVVAYSIQFDASLETWDTWSAGAASAPAMGPVGLAFTTFAIALGGIAVLRRRFAGISSGPRPR